jgi:hypothetical protein
MSCQAFYVSKIKSAQKIRMLADIPLWRRGRRAAYRLPVIDTQWGDAVGGSRWVFRDRRALGK